MFLSIDPIDSGNTDLHNITIKRKKKKNITVQKKGRQNRKKIGETKVLTNQLTFR